MGQSICPPADSLTPLRFVVAWRNESRRCGRILLMNWRAQGAAAQTIQQISTVKIKLKKESLN
jgi:hypothetical protein